MDAFASPAQLVPGKKYFTHKLGLDYAVLAKSACHALSQIYFQTIFMESDRHIYEKTGLDLQLNANHPVF